VWDEQLTSPGAYLIMRRWEALDAFDRLSQPYHRQLTEGQERLRLSYEPSFDPTQAPPVNYQLPLAFDMLHSRRSAWSDLDIDTITSGFLSRLGASRRRDIDRGVTCIGPQRDDTHFLVNGVDMTTYGSRGQQRTVALSLQLAKRALMLEDRGEEPVLLLDDIMSELDGRRRSALMELLDDSEQVILTTTSWADLQPDFLTRAHCLAVRAGQIESAEPETAPDEMDSRGVTYGQTEASPE
jgi:DNA replication and repair protein RecF